MKTPTLGTLALLLTASLAHAQAPPVAPSTAYRYVDDQGGIHWVKSIDQVPEAYVPRAISPDFRDATVFPAAPPYVRPLPVKVLLLTVKDQTKVESLHGRWASEVRRILTEAWRGRGQDGPQPTLAFSIVRDGRMSIPDVERSSGDLAYDLKARDLLITLRRLPPLPPEYTGVQLHVQLAFANVR